ncbi:MAG: SAM-dependent methyltransferase, partial [Chloroflexota bacterium]|nr:SAM-dependent methyltransferase [Chloroflexota bacterium]
RGRQSGTLCAFRGQHVSSDHLAGVGRQDLTAHVDIGALGRGARTAGLQVVGRTTQAEFLVGCGLEQLLAAEREQHADQWEPLLQLRAAVGRLLDPRVLGGYAVVVLGRAAEDVHHPPLRGLAYRVARDRQE